MDKNLNKVRTKEQHSVGKILYFADWATANKFKAVFEKRLKKVEPVSDLIVKFGMAELYCLMTNDDWKELNKYIKFEKCSWCYRNRDYFFRGFKEA